MGPPHGIFTGTTISGDGTTTATVLARGDNRKSILGDLAILTGGTVFTDELDIKLERATADLFGSTGFITITKEDTIILTAPNSTSHLKPSKKKPKRRV
jgi:chaperonin GroEL (HSP60 family)